MQLYRFFKAKHGIKMILYQRVNQLTGNGATKDFFIALFMDAEPENPTQTFSFSVRMRPELDAGVQKHCSGSVHDLD
ncbi:hypothetical protein HA48_12010 [Pantoea wallisii]|uniref:Uncharacterized protein n=1 Tax=Pantoea wallisii TaxID=1076551 RepID=A0A1X1D8Q5_9GAMM|nr:hypothetical protein [Pantoea wallisii]ORM73007.1 hypothetical protein HA48_12010 [Pantoea wallisii]